MATKKKTTAKKTAPKLSIVAQVKALSYEERTALIDHLHKASIKDNELHGLGQEPTGELFTELE